MHSRQASIYRTTQLEQNLLAAIQVAEATREPQIVDAGNTDHIFIVHSLGTISLYKKVGVYEIVKEDEK